MSGTLAAVLFFFAVSLLLYVLLAGADFGAGILELFLGRKHRQEAEHLVSRAMAPVWEANHVWLVLAVVILFVGFPKVYALLSVHLHLPVMAVLLGIVARGCAFTFRHYDTLTTKFHRLYSRIFAAGSVWTSFFLGVLGGGMSLGRIDASGATYFALYVAPWANPFCFALGGFTCCLFSLLAAIYLVGEAEEPLLRNLFRKKALVAAGALVLTGPVVFLTAQSQDYLLAGRFVHSPFSMACGAVATLLLWPFWRYLASGKNTVGVRLLGATIAILVLLGWFAVQYPAAVRFAGDGMLTFEEAAAPETTLRALLWALGVGVLLIFPALGYLLKIFKWQTFERERSLPAGTHENRSDK